MVAEELTIIIPVYNREVEIARCLDSIAAQTLRPGRVIVVDDGSIDGSAMVARNHPVGVEVVEGSHAGAAAARNVGLELVSTEWTMFFDSDDIMKPTHLETAMAMTGEEVDLVGWCVEYVWLSGKTARWDFNSKDISWHNIMHGALATQRYMARTELFRRAGGWNGDVRIWNDIELGARILALKPRMVRKTDCTVVVYETKDSITGTMWSDKADRYKVSLDALASTLGDTHPDWIDLKTTILAADIAREDKAKGRAMYDRIKRKTLPLKFAYTYQRMGGRGTARLLKPFFSKDEL